MSANRLKFPFPFDYEPGLLVARRKTVVEVMLALGKTIAFTFAEPAQNVYYLAQVIFCVHLKRSAS